MKACCIFYFFNCITMFLCYERLNKLSVHIIPVNLLPSLYLLFNSSVFLVKFDSKILPFIYLINFRGQPIRTQPLQKGLKVISLLGFNKHNKTGRTI
jgi:hypothetical protein